MLSDIEQLVYALQSQFGELMGTQMRTMDNLGIAPAPQKEPGPEATVAHNRLGDIHTQLLVLQRMITVSYMQQNVINDALFGNEERAVGMDSANVKSGGGPYVLR